MIYIILKVDLRYTEFKLLNNFFSVLLKNQVWAFLANASSDSTYSIKLVNIVGLINLSIPNVLKQIVDIFYEIIAFFTLDPVLFQI